RAHGGTNGDTNGGANGHNGHGVNGGGSKATEGVAPLPARQASFGYTSEEMIVVLRPMLADAKEPVGAMGDDTPAAAYSALPRPLFHYVKQRFAEVTNPPIDPLREEMVMSLRVLLGRRANVLEETAEATRLIELKSPILQPEQMAALRRVDQPGFSAATVDAVWPLPADDELTAEAAGAMLRAAVEKLCLEAEEAV
ncbi:MAG: glutamate synthase subunit alpha, partial [Verrucomicrobiae bacterium]|nr:glutamate synthase subunit alpha [Verrucomicrobiae bacterium]